MAADSFEKDADDVLAQMKSILDDEEAPKIRRRSEKSIEETYPAAMLIYSLRDRIRRLGGLSEPDAPLVAKRKRKPRKKVIRAKEPVPVSPRPLAPAAKKRRAPSRKMKAPKARPARKKPAKRKSIKPRQAKRKTRQHCWQKKANNVRLVRTERTSANQKSKTHNTGPKTHNTRRKTSKVSGKEKLARLLMRAKRK